MRVLIFAPFAVAEHHFETDLEIAQRHLDDGDVVTLAVCNADLLTCEMNKLHDLGRCVRCVGRRMEGVKRLSPAAQVTPFLRLSAADRAELRALDTATMTKVDVSNLTIDRFDVGWAVLSSLISHAGPAFDFEAQRQYIHDAIVSAMAVYRSMYNLIAEVSADRVYAFNGRFATMRAAMRAAQARGIDCVIHERGSTFEKYSLWENHLPHEFDPCQDLIRRVWADADPELREAIGAAFYADRVTGTVGNWVSFAGQQAAGLMPEGWRDGVNNIAVFTSSSDENDAVADAIVGNLYSDQYSALERIFEETRDRENVHFWVRIHPRVQQVPDPGAERLMQSRYPHVTVIPAASRVSTYALMRKATRVLTFGSTTGIEATFWGVPSLVGFRAFYDRLGSTYNPSTHEEMIQLLLSEGLPPKDRQGAIIYGYFQKTFGVRFKFFQPNGLFGGSFKNVPLKPKLAFRAAGWLLDRGAGRGARNRLHLKLAEHKLITP
jgi:hypothetical protein